MKKFLNTRSQCVHALASSATLWCLETGEGWQMAPGQSVQAARRLFARILLDLTRGYGHTFFVVE